MQEPAVLMGLCGNRMVLALYWGRAKRGRHRPHGGLLQLFYKNIVIGKDADIASNVQRFFGNLSGAELSVL